MERGLLEAPGPGGVHPQRARIGHVARIQVERGPIRHHLRPDDGGNHELQQRQSDHPPAIAAEPCEVRRAAHYGSTETAGWATWATGAETPGTVRRRGGRAHAAASRAR